MQSKTTFASKLLAAVMALVIVASMGAMALVSAYTTASDDIVLSGDASGASSMIGTFDVTGTGYKYLGYVTLAPQSAEDSKLTVSNDYKYLAFTYTGDITFLRLELEVNGDGTGTPIWFDPTQADHFVTADGSPIVLKAATETQVVLDLAASNFEVGNFTGIHMHYKDSSIESEGFAITDARLMKTFVAEPTTTEAPTTVAPTEATTAAPETTVAPTEATTVAPETTVAPTEATTAAPETTAPATTLPAASDDDIVLDGDAAGASGMIKAFETTGTGYKYLGYVTLAPQSAADAGLVADSSYKYMQITYVGDIRFLRLEFEKDGNSSGTPIWMDSEQEVHFVTVDGNPIPLYVSEPTTVVIDLAMSGVNVGDYTGIHMHYRDPNEPSDGFVVSDARLMKNSAQVDPGELIVPTTAAGGAAATTKAPAANNNNGKSPATGDSNYAVVMILWAVALCGVAVISLKKKGMAK